jgi:hypothetical protein
VLIAPRLRHLAYPMLRAYWVTSEMLARSVFRSSPGIKQVIGSSHAAFTVAILMPWLAILAWLYSRVRGRAMINHYRAGHAYQRTREAGGDPYDRSALRPLGPECGLGAHA